VDGTFCKHYESVVHGGSDAPDETIVDFYIGDTNVIVTNDDLSSISLSESGRIWSVGGYDIEFYSLTPVTANLDGSVIAHSDKEKQAVSAALTLIKEKLVLAAIDSKLPDDFNNLDLKAMLEID
jgi:hypothetical protein